MIKFTPRQEEIVNVSIDLIQEKGIQNLTIRNISKRIGITEGAIYRHFDSKKQIIEKMLSLTEDSYNYLFAKLDKIDSTPQEMIHQIFNYWIELFTADNKMTVFFFSEEMFKKDKVMIGKLWKVKGEFRRRMNSIISEGQKDGSIRDDIESSQLTIIIMGPLRFLINKWYLNDFEDDLFREGDTLWKTIEKLISI